MHKKILISLSLILASFCQTYASDISPLDTANFAKRKTIVENLKKRNKKLSKELSKVYSVTELNYIRPIYNEFDKDLRKDIQKGDYIFYSAFDSVINDTHNKLTAHNPGLEKSCMYFVSRDISLNAMSTVYNTFVINLGSFYFLKNRDEFATLIAHEHAHNYLKHQIASLKNNYKMDRTDAKASVSEIRKNRYGRGARAVEEFKSLLYNKGKMNRQHEFEADSLGYLLYKNSGYNPDLYLNSFRLMLEYDTIKTTDLDISIYKKTFDLPEQAFKDEWLKQEDFSDYDYSKFKDKFDSDSIKSHPELEERINNLKRLFPELNTTNSTDSVVADTFYREIRQTAFYEVFQSLDISEDYGFEVYLCLSELADSTLFSESEVAYFTKWLGKYFTKIHKARKEYTLNRHLEKVDPKEQPKDYQQFLNFMWNLKLPEIEIIAKQYSI
jgi:Zn-dependent protease with chaperone function